ATPVPVSTAPVLTPLGASMLEKLLAEWPSYESTAAAGVAGVAAGADQPRILTAPNHLVDWAVRLRPLGRNGGAGQNEHQYGGEDNCRKKRYRRRGGMVKFYVANDFILRQGGGVSTAENQTAAATGTRQTPLAPGDGGNGTRTAAAATAVAAAAVGTTSAPPSAEAVNPAALKSMLAAAAGRRTGSISQAPADGAPAAVGPPPPPPPVARETEAEAALQGGSQATQQSAGRLRSLLGMSVRARQSQRPPSQPPLPQPSWQQQQEPPGVSYFSQGEGEELPLSQPIIPTQLSQMQPRVARAAVTAGDGGGGGGGGGTNVGQRPRTSRTHFSEGF
ncbi:hypothetical protein Vretimale_14746, partial [Volvox reticuliferus]